MRAARDATALETPLYLIQASDKTDPKMTKETYAKLLNHYNPFETGSMHGMLAAHVGMRVRLLETLDKKTGLVKNAEGTIVKIIHDPLDDALVAQAWSNNVGNETIYLTRLPQGIWLRMDAYESAPFVDLLMEHAPGIDRRKAAGLVFLEPTTPRGHFTWRELLGSTNWFLHLAWLRSHFDSMPRQNVGRRYHHGRRSKRAGRAPDGR